MLVVVVVGGAEQDHPIYARRVRAPPWLCTLSAHYSVISRATLLKEEGGRDQSIVMGQCFAAPFMNPGWLCKLSTVITHVNYTKMVAHIDPQRGFCIMQMV